MLAVGPFTNVRIERGWGMNRLILDCSFPFIHSSGLIIFFISGNSRGSLSLPGSDTAAPFLADGWLHQLRPTETSSPGGEWIRARAGKKKEGGHDTNSQIGTGIAIAWWDRLPG